jgi:hypothetical protein
MPPQGRSGIVAGSVSRSKPVACDDAEVAAAGAGMCPPELAIRVGGFPRGDHAGDAPAFVDGDHFDRIQVVRGEAELATEEAEGSAHDMSTQADVGIFAERNHCSPVLEQRLEGVSNHRASLDGDSGAIGVVVDALHRGDVDEHAHVGIGDEAFKAVPAARDDDTPPFADGILDR